MLNIEPTGDGKEPWDIICFSNSDYAGDHVTRQGVSGFRLCILDVTVSWQSKAVILSSSEVEWMALMEAVKEVIFIIKLLQTRKVSVKLAGMIRVDNMGTIFMADK